MNKIARVIAGFTVAVFAALGANAAETKPAVPAAKPAAEKTADQGPSVPAERTDKMGKDQGEWINNDIRKMDGKIDLAFVGDSITRRWAGENWKKHWGAYRAVNMGIGGDRTQNVLWRLKEGGQLDGYKARVFVVLIGTNNCDKTTAPADIAEGIKGILELIKAKQPQAKIILMGIFPTGKNPHPGRETQAAVNEIVRKFADDKTIHFFDLWDKFLGPDGISKEVMPDYLHLGDKGYDIWAEAISAKVKELLASS